MNEVLVTSSSGDAVVSVNVWDAMTCTNLMAYRGGGIISPKSLSLLGKDYLIAAEKSKPLLRAWPINGQQPLYSPRLLCPGKVSIAVCSPDSCYIAISVQEKLHIFQVCSGELMGSGVRHYQAITVIRWSNDGSILVCGGEDGIVTVWCLSSLLNKDNLKLGCEPRNIFTDHSLPVTDLIYACGASSLQTRLISVSSDRTCKIYDLASGKILLSIIFTEMLFSVAITPNQMEIFVGTQSGQIDQFSLRDPKNVASPEVHISSGMITGDSNLKNVFSGHVKTVNCLSISIDGERLVSGSVDETVRIWHLSSKQCLKILYLKGPVTNAFFMNGPKEMLENENKKTIVLCPFGKIDKDEDLEYCLEIINDEDLCFPKSKFNDTSMYSKKSFVSEDDDYSAKDEIQRLRSINEKMYKISIQNLFQKRVEGDEEVKNDNENLIDKNVMENIFDNFISYQKQPNLNKKRNKKNKNSYKNKQTEEINEDINMLSMKSSKYKPKNLKRKRC